MEKYSVFVPKILPKEENFVSGRRSCKGCGKALALRIAAKAIKEATPFSLNKNSSLNRLVSSGFNWNESSFSSIVELLLESIDKKDKIQKPIIAIDFSVFSKNLVSLHSIVEKDKNLLLLIYDNEPYMDEIVNAYRPLPFGVDYHQEFPGIKELLFTFENKNFFHTIEKFTLSYAASASASYPFDLIDKIKNALNVKGTSLLHIHSPCPTGWIFPSSETIKAGILAVESGFHQLWEYKNKKLYVEKLYQDKERLNQYINFQKRYRYMPKGFIDMLFECIEKESNFVMSKIK
ncbi:MAG: hypothetical protein D6734_06690 [Candidatus Schekmanbacteria bacterium]|nr:MAG: hypothetical protein D6734_06690 [Candidatus Schekmanbacteria bacterium]